MNIELTFHNRCERDTAPTVLVFQRDSDPGLDQFPVAWKVIRNCGRGWHHPFTFSTAALVNVSDADGNHLPPLAAIGGAIFEVSRLFHGRRFGRGKVSAPASSIVVRNAMPAGAVDANLYSGGALVAVKTNLAPDTSAVLRLRNQLWVALAEGIAQGERFDADALAWPAVEISLLGLRRADIVLSDNVVPDSEGFPYQISLEHVIRA